MIFSAKHTVQVEGCPAQFVVREPSYAEARQWADAHDRALETKNYTDAHELAAAFVARCLIRIEGKTEDGNRETIGGPIDAAQLLDLLPLRFVVPLALEVQAAGFPKPKPSPTGEDSPT